MEDIAIELVKQHAENLDNVAIWGRVPYTEDDYLIGKLGFVICLYVENPHEQERRERLMQAAELYRQACGDKAPPLYAWEDRPTRGVPSKGIDYERGLSRLRGQGFSFLLTHKDHHTAEHHNLAILAPADRGPDIPELGYFYATLPTGWGVNAHPYQFVPLMLKLCEIIQPVHGTIGMGLIPPPWQERAYDCAEQLYPLLHQHIGLDAYVPSTSNLLGGMSSVNWLNAIDNQLLEKLGGMAALRASLPETEYPVYNFGSGVLIQAGSAPALGDREVGDLLPQYRAVAKFLKPIRVPFRPASLYVPPGAINNDASERQAAIEYLQRFDD
ncbi:type VI immunity family protein [Chitinimonas sp. JJ19]|uniref:type VI immunity family protein n=1 Tax=Chitinimonas sp. JJ19 TaxID=3109352 RepID=UPI002FFE60BD